MSLFHLKFSRAFHQALLCGIVLAFEIAFELLKFLVKQNFYFFRVRHQTIFSDELILTHE